MLYFISRTCSYVSWIDDFIGAYYWWTCSIVLEFPTLNLDGILIYFLLDLFDAWEEKFVLFEFYWSNQNLIVLKWKSCSKKKYFCFEKWWNKNSSTDVINESFVCIIVLDLLFSFWDWGTYLVSSISISSSYMSYKNPRTLIKLVYWRGL